ncbi:homoprotocatechuate degradation operon regulator HpaR [Sphingomonas sp.]|uniref:homoprotocatechuate degradation operon regulator HpaR n=1 Tax=Sphingomonas sp. TaxID=28214 RepID=UPI002DD6334C|nr:homoprotocatechuate degradation operon regulator HpaR [Sphingomonas sp.]
MTRPSLLPYNISLAGTLLAAREAVMAPIRPFLREAGVTEQQWRVLRVLSDATRLDPSTLATHAMLHPPSVTRILRDLLDKGLIVRSADETDGRRSFIALTDEGRAVVEHTAEHTMRILRQYEEHFGKARLAAMRSELKELADTLNMIA